MKTYAEAATPQVRNTTKPIFIKEIDFFGVKSPPKDDWISNVELYKALALVVPGEHLAGIQRIPGGLWRIYLDNYESRNSILSHEFAFRGKTIPVYGSNPNVRFLKGYHGLPLDPTLRVRIKHIPLSADDGQIKRALELAKCEIIKLYREKLRVDGRLTNCETGDRIAIIKEIDTPLPTFMQMGKYRAGIYHKGQVN